MICDRGIIQSKKKLFYTDIDRNVDDVFRVIDESYFKKYKPKEMKRMQFDIDKGIIKEFFGNKPFSLELPISSGKDITEMFMQQFLVTMAKERMIDDLLFTIIRNITSILGVYYDKSSKLV